VERVDENGKARWEENGKEKQRWAPALFSRFRAREREAKKRARKREEKRARKKAKAPSAKEKKCEFALFPKPTVEIRFQSPKPLGRGEKQGS
jgi:hypothetical protein